jgi:hypothetical protein
VRIAPAGQPVGKTFVSPGASPFEQLAKLASHRSVFISYKNDDLDNREARAFLDQLALELSRKNIAVWMDRVALAGTGGQKLPRESNTRLTELLTQGLDESRIVLGFWKDGYGTPSTIDNENWTQKEWHGGKRGTKRIALDPRPGYKPKRGMRKPHGRVLLPSTPDPSHAKSMAERIERKCRPFWQRA